MDPERAPRLMDFAFAVASAADLDDFRATVTTGVRSVIDADLASYTEVDLASGRVHAPLDPVIDASSAVEALGRLAHQHPLVAHRAAYAQTISDFLSRRRFHALELYNDVYRPLGAEDQLAISLPTAPGKAAGVALNRDRRTFSEGDRRALDQLRPLLVRGYAQAKARERARQMLAQLPDSSARHDLGVAVLDHELRIEYATGHVRDWLDELAAGPSGLRPLERWLRAVHVDAEAPLTLEIDTGRLEITRCHIDGEPGLLEIRKTALSAHTSQLTPRQRTILGRVATGESNDQIALALDVSRRTVENHLQAIYRKLDVSNRTAAAAKLSQAEPVATPPFPPDAGELRR